MGPEIYHLIHPEDINISFLLFLKRTLIQYENALLDIPAEYAWAKALSENYANLILETIEENK